MDRGLSTLPLGSRPCTCGVPPPPRFLVITGGPGAGKTAVLEMARRSFCRHVAILPEAAGIVFSGGFPRSAGTAARCAAQRAIYHVQRQLETLAAAEPEIAVVLCDRGVLDGAAYWPGGIADYWVDLGIDAASALRRYDVVLHLRTPSAVQGFDHSNPLRVESADQAAALDARIAEAWAGHPRRVFVPSRADFLAKARVVLDTMRGELPPCCHGHELDVSG